MLVCSHGASSNIRRSMKFLMTICIPLFILIFERTNDGCYQVPRGVASFAPQPVSVMPRKHDPIRHRHGSTFSTPRNLHLAEDETESTTGSRYLCLFKDYETLEGPYFFALFDQLFEQTSHTKKTVAFLTTQKDMNEISRTSNFSNSTSALDSRLENLQSSLDLDAPPEVFVLDEWNPVVLEERFPSLNDNDTDIQNEKPSIVWLYGNCNAFYTRHLLRTSGFDRWIQESCASSSAFGSDFENSVFVGEGTGALCIGNSMDSAKASGNDPKGAPELQFHGLQLLGENENSGVVFVQEDENTDNSMATNYLGLEICRDDEVWVWAQTSPQEEGDQIATNFVMAPNRRGTIEKYATLDPVAPLVFRSNTKKKIEGVACYGEPSIDPSRSAQAGTIGDSEWWE